MLVNERHTAIFPWQSQSVESQPHYNDVIMGALASQITSLTIVYSTVYSGADQRKHQSSASLAFVRTGNSLVTGEFLIQRASNAENVCILWRHQCCDWQDLSFYIDQQMWDNRYFTTFALFNQETRGQRLVCPKKVTLCFVNKRSRCPDNGIWPQHTPPADDIYLLFSDDIYKRGLLCDKSLQTVYSVGALISI